MKEGEGCVTEPLGIKGIRKWGLLHLIDLQAKVLQSDLQKRLAYFIYLFSVQAFVMDFLFFSLSLSHALPLSFLLVHFVY